MTIIKDIYTSIFGKDYGPIWEQFAKNQLGSYPAIGEHSVQFPYNDFVLTFEAYTHHSVVGGSSYEHKYTRGRVDFVSPDKFRLVITQQGFFDNIAKLFGTQDITIGNKPFDTRFMVKSNDETKALLTLSNNAIVTSLQNQKTLRFQISDEDGIWGEQAKNGMFMLYCVLDGEITGIDQLNTLRHLFANTLDTLTKLSFIKPTHASN